MPMKNKEESAYHVINNITPEAQAQYYACKKCGSGGLPSGAVFCPWCGAKQGQRTPGKRTRGNGTGSVFRRADTGRWAAQKTVAYRMIGGKLRRETRTVGGFRTKREAVEALASLSAERRAPEITFSAAYEAWRPTHRASKSTMGCYRAAFRWWEPVALLPLSEITIDDLQDCLDDCPQGRRTLENMRTLAGLLYKWAIPRHYAALDLSKYLVINVKGGGVHHEGLPLEALELIRAAVGKVPGADYVLCHCYLGFRPSELLALDVSRYNRTERAFVGGAKTDAGRDRVVTVSPKIQPIISRLTADKIAGPVFCRPDGSAMSIKEYRALFYSVLDACGIENPEQGSGESRRRKYTPHSCRHTFATLMKRAAGADKDKMELIGHTSGEMLRYYQDVAFDDLRRVTDAL